MASNYITTETVMFYETTSGKLRPLKEKGVPMKMFCLAPNIDVVREDLRARAAGAFNFPVLFITRIKKS